MNCSISKIIYHLALPLRYFFTLMRKNGKFCNTQLKKPQHKAEILIWDLKLDIIFMLGGKTCSPFEALKPKVKAVTRFEALIDIFQKMRIKNMKGVSEVRFKKNRLLHLRSVEKPPHPQLFAQRAPEG